MAAKTRLKTITTLLMVLAGLIGCGRAPSTPLSRAAGAGDAGQVRALLDGGADPNDMGRTGLTPLMYAARAGQADAAAALLAKGADPDVSDRSVTGWTALIHAVHKGQTRAAVAILDGGATVDLRVGDGETALIYAAAYGNTDLVRELIAHGADPRARSDDGATAIWAALGGGSLLDITDGPPLGTCFPETARVLLEKAPDLTLETDFATRLTGLLGRSPECEEIVSRLRAAPGDRARK